MNHKPHEALNCFLYCCITYVPKCAIQHQRSLHLALARAHTLMRLRYGWMTALLQTKLRASFCWNILSKYSNIHVLTWIFSFNLTCHFGIHGRVSNPNWRFLKTVTPKVQPSPSPQNNLRFTDFTNFSIQVVNCTMTSRQTHSPTFPSNHSRK